jgi:hypothetical protein
MRRALAVWLALGVAQPGAAMMACEHYDAMVAEAVTVIQIVPALVTPPPEGGQGNCTVTGEIVRIFKGFATPKTVVSTILPCEAPLPEGIERPILVGPTMWVPLSGLGGAGAVELHLDEGGFPTGYGAGVVLLDAPTDAPAWRPVCQ